MRQLLAALGAVALLAVAPAAAHADEPRRSPQQALADGVEAYVQVQYGQAVMYLSAALKGALEKNTVQRAYFYLGCTYLAQEKHDEARAAFERLLASDPAFVPDRKLTSPKIGRFFESVRRSYPTPPGPPELSHVPPRRLARPFTELRVVARNVTRRLRVRLRYRAADAPGFFTVAAEAGGAGAARFRVPTREARAIRYYFELVDDNGIVHQRLGEPAQAFSLERRRRRRRRAVAASTPWYRRWWVWTLVGVAAAGAGAGVGIYAATRGGDASEARVTILRRDASGQTVPAFK
ncbi:MAG: tetratricopeptide repeat protein [Myxococcales bacterium]|nr:tetratricopeptide repeat protein [Myxococcales bacterium]